MSLVSYAVGSPDSPRSYVGLVAVTVLGLTGGGLLLAGRLAAAAGVRLPLAVPAVGALAVVPLVVLSAPLQYDQDPPAAVVGLATAGVVGGGAALATRGTRRAVAAGGAALASLLVVCVLLDAGSLLPRTDGGAPVRSPVPGRPGQAPPAPPLPSLPPAPALPTPTPTP